MICMNLIKDNQVTTEDVNLDIKVYGPDMGAIKGKTTRTKPIPITSNLIKLSDKLVRMNKDVVLSIDGMKDMSVAEYEEKLDEIKALYDRGGFIITKIHCDNEFYKTMNSFAPKHDPPIKVDFASAQERV
eukprot:13601742-Ditylum_brightwellii.AAC.1